MRNNNLCNLDFELLTHFLPNFTPISVYNEVTEETDTAMNTNQFKYLMLSHLGKRFIKHDPTNTDLQALNLLWSSFLAEYKKMYVELYNDLQLEYNPLDNVDKYSDITTNGGNTIGERINDDTITNAKRHTDSTIDNRAYGYNSENYSNGGKTITSSDSDLTQDTVHSVIGSQLNTNNSHMVEHTHGNIGVVDSVTLIKNEMELRKMSLNKWFVDLFANQNLFYC